MKIPITIYQELYDEDVLTFEIMVIMAGDGFEITNIGGNTYLKYVIE